MTTGGALPEEAVVDAVLFDPLGAQTLLAAFARSGAQHLRQRPLSDISRNENIARGRIEALLVAFQSIGLIRAVQDGYELCVTADDALRYAGVLRGVAYAQHRHRDANEVEITLSPPARPSRLMDGLPKQGFSWARLHDTKDSLIELASRARRRFVVISPFLDDEGLGWIGALFEASARNRIERVLVVRGRDETELDVLRAHRSRLALWDTQVLTYAIAHDPALRKPTIETFHAKILLADSDRAYIGSANMNRWSRDFSMECGVIIGGPCVRPVATLVDAMISVAELWQP